MQQILTQIYYASGNINTMDYIISPGRDALLLNLSLYPARFITSQGYLIRELRDPLPCAAFNDIAKNMLDTVRAGDVISICGQYIEGSYLAERCDTQMQTRHILITGFLKIVPGLNSTV